MEKPRDLQGKKPDSRANFDSKRPDLQVQTDHKRPDLGLKTDEKCPETLRQFTLVCSVVNAKTVIDDENSRGNLFVGAIPQLGGEIILVFEKHNGI
jgi:hypothetical protein